MRIRDNLVFSFKLFTSQAWHDFVYRGIISLEKAINSNNTPQVKDAEQGQQAPRARYDMALLVKPRVRKLS